MTDDATGQQQACPVAHPVDIRTIPKAGLPVAVTTDADQRRVLAEMHGLESVASFDADLLLEPWRRDGVRITGKVEAQIVQQCIVTLEPIETRVAEDIELLVVPEEQERHTAASGQTEIVIDAESPDEPDTFSGNVLDVGAIAEEFFALALDPYPRAEGVHFETESGKDSAEDTPSPFAKLAALRDRK